ncbi:MAG: hypothetical protein KJ676_08265 [Alphaproteobacteria bacterium]|nr:hypothetical protein [Alphaproteobacteria bacterium]MBU1524758.1 hypothetical protein [Alphaproteobacteria bacterium]MBU2116044.1 hypothetical protein [Alphaproteobacteria bacterium]MBU2351754.1 hypothetical protein [Alphaproteobacteria bacterium]MBU2383416.1 hypothetical protein [Alphaproteobacteria bacterium]
MTIVSVLHGVAYCVAAVWSLLWLGNVVCRTVLERSGLTAAVSAATGATAAPAIPPLDPRAGRLIGSLERSLIATGLLVQSWEVLAAVIALKTVSRFKEIDERLQAEYFLVGSLLSIAWAMLVTACWALYDHHLGLGLFELLPRQDG